MNKSNQTSSTTTNEFELEFRLLLIKGWNFGREFCGLSITKIFFFKNDSGRTKSCFKLN